MSRKGFTLLEVLLVVVILAILASISFTYMHFVESARIDVTQGRVNTLGMHVGTHLNVKNKLPATLESLMSSLGDPAWVKDGKLVDSWDRPFEYRVDGREFRIWSCGPDGISGTDDDIQYKRK